MFRGNIFQTTRVIIREAIIRGVSRSRKTALSIRFLRIITNNYEMPLTNNYQSCFRKRASRLLLHDEKEFESNIGSDSQHSAVIIFPLPRNVMNDAHNTCRKRRAILKARNATFARRSIEFSRHYATALSSE